MNVFDESEVGHLDSSADQQQVLRLHVQVLQRVLRIHVVQGVGSIAEMIEQLSAGNAGLAFLHALFKSLLQAFVRELGDDQ